MSKPNWLPNLVGGVSIWKLGQDLNQPRFFDGRLLVPETEGSESLPNAVTWDLTSLVPLREARTSHPAEAEKAVADFLACLDVVSKEFASETSGYFKFRDALTFPRGLDLAQTGDDAYYFDPASGKLKVINWGACPREIAGSQKLVFGWEDWGALRKAGAAVVAGAGLGAAAAGVAVVAGAAPGENKDEKKDEKPKDKQDAKKRRPWWHWLLVALAALAILLLILWLLRSCVSCNPQAGAADGATDGLAEGAIAAEAGLEDGADATDGANGADADPDAVVDGASDATDAGDGGDAAKKDGAADDDDDDDEPGAGGGGGSGGGGGVGSGGGGGGSGGGGGGGGGPAGPTDRPKLHAVHPNAVRWKISRGTALLHKGQAVAGQGRTFDVTLKRGKSFRDVTVEWQDKKGVWHTF